MKKKYLKKLKFKIIIKSRKKILQKLIQMFISEGKIQEKYKKQLMIKYKKRKGKLKLNRMMKMIYYMININNKLYYY